MIIVLHSGQTGVERGAQRAAAAMGIPVAGFCMPSYRDELGSLPSEVRRDLTPCHEAGPRYAVDANLAIASAAIVVVPDAKRVTTFTGMATVLRTARARCIAYHVVDPSSSLEEVGAWIARQPKSSGSMRLYVTGPRQTRWADGERLGWQLVARFATTSAPKEEETIPGARRWRVASDRREPAPAIW
jgi:hypothetical protein